MGEEVKTPGQVLREALGSPTMFLYRHTCPITGLQYLSPKTRINGFASDEAVGAFVLASADADRAAQAVLAADRARRQSAPAANEREREDALRREGAVAALRAFWVQSATHNPIVFADRIEAGEVTPWKK